MKKKFAIIGAVLALVLIVVLSALLIVQGGQIRRNNRLILASDYIDQGEYDRALDLIEGILLRDSDDEAAILLRNRALILKNNGILPSEGDGVDREGVALGAEAGGAGERASGESELADSAGNPNQAGDPSSSQTAERSAEAERAAASRAAADQAARAAQAERAASAQAAQAEQQRQEELRRQQELARLRAQEAEIARRNEAEAALRREINDLLLQARSLQDSNRHAQARRLIEQAIDLDPNYALPYARLAENFVEDDIRNPSYAQQAREAAQSAIDRDPELWEPHYTLGRLYNAMREFSSAINALMRAAELNGRNADIYYALGNAQFDTRQYRQARASYETCIGIDPLRVNAHFNLGLTFERLNLSAAAIESYTQALAIQSDYASAYNRIGEILLQEGEYTNALSNLMQALSLENNARNNRAIARAYYEQGRYSEAYEFFATTLAIEPDRAQNHYNMATVLLELNRPSDALAFAAEAITLDSDNPEYNYTMGLAVKNSAGQNNSNATRSLEFFNRAIELRSDYINPRIEISELLIESEQFDSALAVLQDAYRIDSSRADVNNNLATIYRLQGNFDTSLRHSTQAVNSEPESPLIRYNLSLTLIGLEQFVQAESNLRRTIDLDANYLDAYLRLADVLLAQERSEDAQEVLDSLIARSPNSTQAGEARSRKSAL